MNEINVEITVDLNKTGKSILKRLFDAQKLLSSNLANQLGICVKTNKTNNEIVSKFSLKLKQNQNKRIKYVRTHSMEMFNSLLDTKDEFAVKLKDCLRGNNDSK